MAFMFVCMSRAGVSPRPLFAGWRDEKVRLVWHNLAIAAAGAGTVQVNYMLDQVLGQLAAPWAAGVIGYAERLMDLPLGVIGVAFGTVLLPTFSGFFAKGDVDGARAALVKSVVSLLTLMIPAGIALALLAGETVRVIYEGGAFGPAATVRVARALTVYALGLGFFGFQKTLIPWFQAQKDMKTPLMGSIYTVILNTALNVLAVFCLPVEWRHVGLAGSTTLCSVVACLFLGFFASRRNGPLGLAAAVPSVLRILLASFVMAAVILLLKPLVATWRPVFALAALVAAGGAVYGLCALVLLRRFRFRPAHRGTDEGV